MGRVVVAAAIVSGGRLLAQQRARPAELAGRWELPGGVVEVAESERSALVRECAEELGVLIVPGERVGHDVELPGGRLLKVYAATLDGGGTGGIGAPDVPRAVEHAAVRWVSGAQMGELDWLDADRVLLPRLRELLDGIRRSALGDRRGLPAVHPAPGAHRQ